MSNTANILAEYDRRSKLLLRFETDMSDLLRKLLATANISFHSIQSRVKDKESLRRKCERPDKNYQQFDDLTDIVAFRVITYFDDDVDKVERNLSENFAVDPKRSIDKRKRAPGEFGYTALHCICAYDDTRSKLPENSAHADLKWEVQVCSILQHAWNEIEHDIGYKAKEVPIDIKRRLYRLAGVLELADIEFHDIRTRAENYRMAVELRLDTEDDDLSDVLLDSISLTQFISQDQVLIQAIEAMANHFSLPTDKETPEKTLDTILAGLQLLQVHTLQQLRDLIKENSYLTSPFIEGCITQFEQEGTPVHFERVTAGTVLLNLIILLVGSKGEKTLAQFFSDNGTFGEFGDHVAEVQVRELGKLRKVRISK